MKATPVKGYVPAHGNTYVWRYLGLDKFFWPRSFESTFRNLMESIRPEIIAKIVRSGIRDA